METTQLKKFAQEARKSLLNFVKAKLDVVIDKDSLARSSSPKAVEALDGLIKEIGKEEVIEKVAYTWFNRFCALRFMDANRYTKIGIVSPAEGETLPEIFSEAKQNFIDDKIVNAKNITKIKNLLNGTEVSLNPQDEAYRILLVSYCNYYHEQLPFMFERIDDYTELLMPDDLLSKNSVLYKTVEILDSETCKDVEVIGWLYQYYISEKKDSVFADLEKGKKILKEDIPAATQIFTPKWIVSYMVENSVGKLWLEAHPDERLQSQFKYYLESAKQEPEVQVKLNEIIDKNIKPQDIKVLDPACGSGHILVKAFDVLYAIYKNEGYSDNEIPETILKNNLFGLDICDRASQLAQFAVMMKARQYDRSIFTKIKSLNICSIKDTNWMDSFVIDEILQKCPNNPTARKQVELLRDTFKDAKEYGSIINVKGIDFDFWNNCLENFKNEGQIRAYTPIIKGRLPYTLKQARIMQQKYECVITNPPYMGSKGMNEKLSTFAKKMYPNSKNDLFAMFMELIQKMTKKNYIFATINQHTWMFNSRYVQLREFLYNNISLISLLHLGARAFEEINGEKVKTATFSCRNFNHMNHNGIYINLTEYQSTFLKESAYLEQKYNKYICNFNYFSEIIGKPMSYWISEQTREVFINNKPLKEFADARQGMATGNNDLFVRAWYEVNFNKIGFGFNSIDSFHNSNYKFVPYIKSSGVTKWYGNYYNVLAFDKTNYNLLSQSGNKLPSRQYYFRDNFNWSLIGGNTLGARLANFGGVFDVGAHAIYAKENLYYYGALLNSKVLNSLIKILGQSVNFNSGIVQELPAIILNNMQEIESIAKENVQLAKDLWDNNEYSWDFKRCPLLTNKCQKIKDSCINYINFYTSTKIKIKNNEEKLNRYFIEGYGLSAELTPESYTEVNDITEIDLIKSLLSYSVGCMFGRYSLDKEGLVYAGGEFDRSKYKTFTADEDAVIPVLSEHLFSDDLTSRFKEFIKVAFGETYFDENLDYVAGVLGKKNNETADEVLRNYFMKDFYNDHLKMYQKRPIYWMFSSPKGNFNTLIYMHRYNKDTVSVVLNSYLQEYKNKLNSNLKTCKDVEVSTSATQTEKTKAQKDIGNIMNILKEIEDYGNDVLYPLATERKEIDLDDGVKVNYLKFGKALKDFGLKAK